MPKDQEEPRAGQPETVLLSRTETMREDSQYAFITHAGGQAYAFALEGRQAAACKVCPEGECLSVPLSAAWYSAEDDTIDNAGAPGMRVHAVSMGLLIFPGGRPFVYQPESRAVLMNDMYYLTFDPDSLTFGQSKAEEDACSVTLYGRKLPPRPKVRPVIPPDREWPPEERQAAKNADGSITLCFVTDIHHSTDYAQNNLQVWFERVAPQVGYIDAMASLGDMGSAYSPTPEVFWRNAGAVYAYMDSVLESGRVRSMVWTFGNHEWYPFAGGDYIRNSHRPETGRLRRVGEALVTPDYRFFCLGSGSLGAKYSQGYSLEDIGRLADWLATAPGDIPLFVLGHYPIHYWGDRLCENREPLLELLNGHPNVVFLWGHNHSDFDRHYDRVFRPGSVLTLDHKGCQREIRFTYLSAGCISDREYTGPHGGSAWVQGKGLVVTIRPDRSLVFTYYDQEGNPLAEQGTWLVEFREGVGYETLSRCYVSAGEAAPAPEPRKQEGFRFIGWD